MVIQVEIRRLKGNSYTNRTVCYVFFAYMITLGWLNELPGIDREVKSDLAGGSKHSTPKATHANPEATQKYESLLKKGPRKKKRNTGRYCWAV